VHAGVAQLALRVDQALDFFFDLLFALERRRKFGGRQLRGLQGRQSGLRVAVDVARVCAHLDLRLN
jgi:hypothetical protein